MKIHLEVGDLNRRIEIQAAVTTQDSSGDPVVEWTPIGTFWAAAEPDAGQEFYADNGIVSESPMLFRLRYYPSVEITALHRVIYGGAVFNIDSVTDHQDARTEVHIYARAGVNQG